MDFAADIRYVDTMWPVWTFGWWSVAVAVLGAIVGSFLNVVIVRLPRGESIVIPRSHCVFCRHPLAWWENIPIVSFLFLHGQCRHCERRISWRYPTVEVLTALLSLLLWWRYEALLPYTVYFFFLIAPLIALSFIDLEHLIIPDVLSLTGIATGLVSRLVLSGYGDRWEGFFNGVVGVLVGGGLLFVVAWGYERLKHQEGLGGGDVKLAAMLGAFFGWRASLFILLVSSVLGSVVGLLFLVALKKGLKHPIPFGPFLSLAGLAYLFIGPELIHWYLKLFH